MDAYTIVRELWLNSDYMGALTAVWKLPATDNYAYLLSSVQLRDLTLRELVFRACRQAVAVSFAGLAERQRAVQWVETFLRDFSPPAALIAHSDREEERNDAEDYRRAMIHSHLHCVRVILLRQGKLPPGALADASLSRELTMAAQKTDLPLPFFHSLLCALLPEEHGIEHLQTQHPTVSLTALLAGERTAGIVATLTLALIPGGSGIVFPAPALAFVRRDDAFRKAEQAALSYVKNLGLWKADYDVCWQLERRDGQAIGALKGSSMGFAFALGLAKLLTPS
jgi:hypothetical protein